MAFTANTMPKYLYVLMNDGHRMTGNYGKVFTDRVTARSWKTKANSSSKIDGRVTIVRYPVGNEWEAVR